MQRVEKPGEAKEAQMVDPNLDSEEMAKVIESVKDFIGRGKRNMD